MNRLSAFFKGRDTHLGLFYPEHYLLAVFPNLARGKLRHAGCGGEDMISVSGEELGLPMIKRMLFGFFPGCAFARTAPTSSRIKSIRPISLTACCTTSRISGYVAAAAMSLANSLILGLPIAASTAATTFPNGFCETMLHRWTLTVGTSILLTSRLFMQGTTEEPPVNPEGAGTTEHHRSCRCRNSLVLPLASAAAAAL